ncbi:MAG: hypothetical protein KatS3mg020_0357 [Fimbriimonadales bacterium]|nr:MAG: hypothetical protein KatS3mg020_0357 [Fimbriimonadales bacterium]
MRTLLACGWLLVSLWAFWLAYGAAETSATLYRAGMAVYALLLTLSLVVAARKWLNTSKHGGNQP